MTYEEAVKVARDGTRARSITAYMIKSELGYGVVVNPFSCDVIGIFKNGRHFGKLMGIWPLRSTIDELYERIP